MTCQAQSKRSTGQFKKDDMAFKCIWREDKRPWGYFSIVFIKYKWPLNNEMMFFKAYH